jgi:molecular chaperone DnaK (HSP70)
MIRSAVEALFPGRIRVEHPDLAVVKGAALSALELGQDTKREEQKMELAIDQETDQEKIDQEKIDQGIDQKIDQEIDQILDQEIDQKTDQTETSKPAVYGISLGGAYSAIATLGANNLPEVIENYADGSGTLASAVYFTEDGEFVVGKVAKNQAEIEPERVIQYVKQEIGKKDPRIYTFNGIDYDPIRISALILKRIKEYAEEQGHEVKDVVITCPAYFGNEEREATKQAGIIAGFNVLNIVNEPTAAALYYCSHELNESRKILVFDLGGGTFDVTLIDFSVDENGKSMIEIIASNGDDRLGGVDWDAVLNDYMLEVYAGESEVQVNDIPHEIKQRIWAEAEDVKKGLSFTSIRGVSITAAGESARIILTRDEFERRTKHLVKITTRLVNVVLETAGVKAEEVDLVLLVGGSTLMPMIRSAVEALFPGRIRVEQPDLVVAKGAALSAAVEWRDREEKNVVMAKSEYIYC